VDTIGAMAGAIAGGYDAAHVLPCRWVDLLENRERGRDHAPELAKAKATISRRKAVVDIAPISMLVINGGVTRCRWAMALARQSGSFRDRPSPRTQRQRWSARTTSLDRLFWFDVLVQAL
jgi:hypothetical protein